MKRLTVDSSIIVSSLLENEPRQKEARKIWDAVLAGRNVAILPYSVFVEVVAAVLAPNGIRGIGTRGREAITGD